MNLKNILSRSSTWAIILLLPIALWLPGCEEKSSVDPDPDPHKEDRRYMPLGEGNRWEYTYSDVVYDWLVVNSYEGTWADSAEINEHYSDTNSNIYFICYWDYQQLRTVQIDSLSAATSDLSLPVSEGTTWTTFEYADGGLTQTETAHVIKVDTLLTVPAGSFPSALIRKIRTTSDQTQTYVDTAWVAYAKDVGMIFLDKSGIRYELTDYTIIEEDEE